jgi:hypothetical protein
MSSLGAQFGRDVLASPAAYVEFQKERLMVELDSVESVDAIESIRNTIKTTKLDIPRWALYRPWYGQVLSEYTKRKLSFQSDKLPAVSSIARVVQKQIGSTYAAGLWSEDIAFGLAWHPVSPEDGVATAKAPSKLPRRPSWSWSSYEFGCSWQIYERGVHYWK